MARRSALRWILSSALALAGLYLTHLALFHSWLSWGPPTPDPEGHRIMSHRLLTGAVLCFLLAICAVRGLRPRPRTNQAAP